MKFTYRAGGQAYAIVVEKNERGYQAVLNDQPYQVEILEVAPGLLRFHLDSRLLIAHWMLDSGRVWLDLNGRTYQLDKTASGARRGGEASGEGALMAPMPGQVRAVLVAEGDEVERGQTLLILEAMKMEIRIQAARAGRVVKLPVRDGQSVNKDDLLAEVG